MATKVPSPFDSPFAKSLLAIFWAVYAGMLVALVIGRDINLLIIAGWWTFVLPWITWCFLSGVKVEPGQSVGGGPMYPRVALEPNEDVLFQAPALAVPSGGHLFVTNHRVIVAPIRFLFRGARTVQLSEVTSVEVESKGIGWPLPREGVRLTFPGGSLMLRPWAATGSVGIRLRRFMGTVTAEEFVEGLLGALGQAGVPSVQRLTS